MPFIWNGRIAMMPGLPVRVHDAYVDSEGMRIPIEGEVAWLLPDGRKLYWRGRITHIGFE